MTIDERIEALTRRHEALAQSLELEQHRWNDRFERMFALLEKDAENIRALARVAELHERRISGIEGN